MDDEFLQRPAVEPVIEDDDFHVQRNLSHFLVEHLAFTETTHELKKEFRAFAEQDEMQRLPWVEVMEEFADAVSTDECKEGAWWTENTAEYQNLLSQEMRFTVFCYEDQYYVLVQVHGGCNTRGGYTDPRLCTFETSLRSFLDGIRCASAWCTRCGRRWRTYFGGQCWRAMDTARDDAFVVSGDGDRVIHDGCGGEITFA